MKIRVLLTEKVTYSKELKKHVKPFADVKRYFLPTNNTVEEFNAMLREMGETELLEDPKDFVIANQKQK